jgi:hypothetical protein
LSLILKMLRYIVIPCVFFLLVSAEELLGGSHLPRWLINYPADFHTRSSHLGDGLLDVRNSSEQMKEFTNMVDFFLPRVDGYTDGEVVDALEHYFWGQRNGLVIELGALDGSPQTRSQTYEYEKSLGWRRILIEGDPQYKDHLNERSPMAFNVLAAMCSHQGQLHYSDQAYTGGILEFMGHDFLRDYHADVRM